MSSELAVHSGGRPQKLKTQNSKLITQNYTTYFTSSIFSTFKTFVFA